MLTTHGQQEQPRRCLHDRPRARARRPRLPASQRPTQSSAWNSRSSRRSISDSSRSRPRVPPRSSSCRPPSAAALHCAAAALPDDPLRSPDMKYLHRRIRPKYWVVSGRSSASRPWCAASHKPAAHSPEVQLLPSPRARRASLRGSCATGRPSPISRYEISPSEHPPEVLGCEWALVGLAPLVRGQSQTGRAFSRGPAPAVPLRAPPRFTARQLRFRMTLSGSPDMNYLHRRIRPKYWVVSGRSSASRPWCAASHKPAARSPEVQLLLAVADSLPWS